MTSKNAIIVAALTSIALISSQAKADHYPPELPVNSQSMVSRAEVLADLQIYRESGLADVEQMASFGIDLNREQVAKTKYVLLRSSGYYSSLVRKLGRDADSKLASR